MINNRPNPKLLIIPQNFTQKTKIYSQFRMKMFVWFQFSKECVLRMRQYCRILLRWIYLQFIQYNTMHFATVIPKSTHNILQFILSLIWNAYPIEECIKACQLSSSLCSLALLIGIIKLATTKNSYNLYWIHLIRKITKITLCIIN